MSRTKTNRRTDREQYTRSNAATARLTLTQKMTTAQVVETSVTVNDNSPIQDYVHPDDQTQPVQHKTQIFWPHDFFRVTKPVFFKYLLTRLPSSLVPLSSCHFERKQFEHYFLSLYWPSSFFSFARCFWKLSFRLLHVCQAGIFPSGIPHFCSFQFLLCLRDCYDRHNQGKKRYCCFQLT